MLFLRALVRDLLVPRVLNSLSPLPQAIGLALRHFVCIDESSHAHASNLLDGPGHAGAQRLAAEPVFAAVPMVVRLTIALLALCNNGGGNSWKQKGE